MNGRVLRTDTWSNTFDNAAAVRSSGSIDMAAAKYSRRSGTFTSANAESERMKYFNRWYRSHRLLFTGVALNNTTSFGGFPASNARRASARCVDGFRRLWASSITIIE